MMWLIHDLRISKNWQMVKRKRVRFKETIFGIELNVFNINNTLKIKFLILEEYQYNFRRNKERLTKICKLT
jgi:hypothetical protein